MIDILIICLIIVLLPTVLWILFMVGVVLFSSLAGIYHWLTKNREEW